MKFLFIILTLFLSFFFVSCSEESEANKICKLSTDCEKNEVCARDSLCKLKVCNPDSVICSSDNAYQRCNIDGTELSKEIGCLGDQLCDNGSCIDTSCEISDFLCIETDTSKKSYKDCSTGSWSNIKTCPNNEICIKDENKCIAKVCNPNEVRCLTDNGTQEQICNSLGTKWLDPVTCLGENASCKLTEGCIEGSCVANERKCVSQSAYKTCNVDGTDWLTEETSCGDGEVCSNNECVTEIICSQDERECISGTTYRVCDNNSFSEPINCETNPESGELSRCHAGLCKTECELAAQNRSYMGCEYYAVNLDNTKGKFRNDESQTPHYFAIIVSNPSAYTAKVTITDNNGYLITKDIASNAIETFEMDTLTYLGTVTSNGKTFHQWQDSHQIIGTSKGVNYSYKISSNLPIIAYQFSPLGGSTNYSNDASMLIPTAAYDTEYRMLSWEHWNDNSQTMTIVAKEDNTSVTINFSAATKAENSIPEQAAGSNYNVTLSKGETIQFASKNGDLSGSYISADKAIGVFGGHSCTNIPNDKTACDHIEEQLFPLNTWGSHYVSVKTKVRNRESEIYKVITSEPETLFTFNPPINVSGLSNPLTAMTIHGAGEVVEFSTKDNFELTTNKPVFLGQFMVGQNASADTGDPAFILQVPVEQYRDSYLFLVPNTYDENYVTVVVGKNFEGLIPTITLDGNLLSSSDFRAVGDYYYLRKSLSSGTHSIVSEYPIGISIYGYDEFVSYGYPGGLDLRNIKIP